MTPSHSARDGAASKNAASSDNELLVGGQALIEGVMMRAPGAYGVAVRRPDGSIAVQRAKVASLAQRYPALKLPLLRGIAVLFQSLALGIRALNFSAAAALAEASKPGGAELNSAGQDMNLAPPAEEAAPAPSSSSGDAAGWALAGSMAIGLGLGAVIFLLVPLWLTHLGERHLFGPLSSVAFNLVDGGLRALFFLAYIAGISRFKDIHRVFMYHGAEHKVVFVHEKRLPLTVDSARQQSRLHPRCGTSFLLFVLLVSIFVFALIPKTAPFVVKFGGRLLLVPLVAGVSYEVLRLTAKRRAAPLFGALVWPGLMLQKITTQEPTDDMLEVAIVALVEALREDGRLPEAGAGAEPAEPAAREKAAAYGVPAAAALSGGA
jgi:uncharacterized protein YqhQ